MRFSVHGPFDLPRRNGLIASDAVSKRRFWDEVESEVKGLPDACGCYIFVVKASKGALPWYVGRTTKRSFRVEAIGAHQIIHYDNAINNNKGKKRKNGKPQLFLFAKRTPGGRLAKASSNGHKDIEFLETLMFGVGLQRNHQLQNAKNTKFLKNLVVPCVLNSPRRPRTAPESALGKALGL